MPSVQWLMLDQKGLQKDNDPMHVTKDGLIQVLL